MSMAPGSSAPRRSAPCPIRSGRTRRRRTGRRSCAIDGLLDKASGHKILPDILLLRLLEIAGLALVVAATPTLARRLGRDPAEAVLLGAGCPLVLTTLIGGAHNEALMLGLLVAGLAVAQRWGTDAGHRPVRAWRPG